MLRYKKLSNIEIVPEKVGDVVNELYLCTKFYIMKRFLFLVLSLILATLKISAQERNSESLSCSFGRYEIIQSPSISSYMLKINKQTGDTWLLVRNNEKKDVWQKFSRESSAKDIQKDDCVNYQIFMSGSIGVYVFLININTGITWRLVKDPNRGYFWVLMEDNP